MNIGVFNVVPEISDTVLISFLSFFFTLFMAVISTILSFISFIYSSASVILLLISSSVFFISGLYCSSVFLSFNLLSFVKYPL